MTIVAEALHLEDALRMLRRFREEWDGTTPLRASVPLREIDVFAWLAGQSNAGNAAGFWQDRKTDVNGHRRRVAFCGVAASWTDIRPTERDALDVVRSALVEGMRAYGGFSFSGPGRFVVPAFECDGESLTINLLRGMTPTEPASPATVAPVPRVLKREDFPDRNGWSKNVLEALDLFEREVLDKIVLARRTDFICEADVSPVGLLQSLSAGTHHCFGFMLPVDRGGVFVGASPELLFRRRGDRLSSDVLAGTRPRGVSVADDERLGQELLSSPKDQLEHDIVRKSIRQALHAVCRELDVDDTASLMRLAKKQHLYSQVSARLRQGVSDGELLHRLHPTPAVGGYPRDNALVEIERLEPFDREWYAAPVGWLDVDGCEFAVGIRSGMIRGNCLSLFSGAGIVPGSRAAEEWDEIEHKIVDFLERLPD